MDDDPLAMLPARFVADDVRAMIGALPAADLDSADQTWHTICELIEQGHLRCGSLAVLAKASAFDGHREAVEEYLAGQRAELDTMRGEYEELWREFSASAARAREIYSDALSDVTKGQAAATAAQQELAAEQQARFSEQLLKQRARSDQAYKDWLDNFTRRY